MSMVTSNQNPVIKEIKALRERKFREEKRLFFIEGIRFVEEALNAGAGIELIMVSERLQGIKGGKKILEKAAAWKHKVVTVSDRLFREVSDTENPQGVLAVVKMMDYSLVDVVRDNSLVLILDSLQDPGNMGTIIRTADAAGVTGIIISKGCVDIYNPKVLRSTMGSVFHVPFCITDNLNKTVEWLKSNNIRLLAAHLDGASNYFDLDLKGSIAFIVGNEANGISDEIASLADLLVKIPMPGKAESLNASVAAGLLMYEAVRQRMSVK